METRRLHYFLAMVECGSISRAAAQLRLAQPALSQQLAVLESEMQAQLLTRSAKGVSPTQAGLALYRHARVLLRHLEQVQAEVQQLAGAYGVPFSVGFPLSTAALLSMPLLAEVRRRYPNIRLQILEDLSGSLAAMMRNDRLDLAVLFENQQTADLRMQPLWTEELFLVVPPRAAVATTVELHEVANFDLVLPSAKNGSRLVLEAALAREGLPPRIVAELDSIPTLKAAVAEGIGYTVLPWAAVYDDVRSSRLKVVSITGQGFTRTVSLCMSRTLLPTPATECVARVIQAMAARLIKGGASRGMGPPAVRKE